jgi:hypothetical protein
MMHSLHDKSLTSDLKNSRMEIQKESIREIGSGVHEKKVSLKETFIGDNDPYNDRHKDTEQYRR